MEMSDNKTDVPQVSCNLTTGSDRVKASVASARSTDSGESKLSLLSETEKRDQREAEPTQRREGMEQETENPFKKRNALSRTPPRPRTNSLPELSETVKVGQPAKRKRTEEKIVKEKSCDKEASHENTLKDILSRIEQQAKALERTLSEMYKPKQELKEISSALALQVELLRTHEMREWIEERTGDIKEKEGEALRNEIQELRKQLSSNEKMYRREMENTTSNQIQCKNCKEEQRKWVRRQELAKDDSYDTFKQVTEDDWRDEIFPRIPTKRDNIWEAPSDQAMVLPCNKDLTSSDRAVATVIERLGGKENLLSQGKRKGEVAMMQHSLAFPDDQGNFKKRTRVIYYPITTDGAANEGDEWILQCLT